MDTDDTVTTEIHAEATTFASARWPDMTITELAALMLQTAGAERREEQLKATSADDVALVKSWLRWAEAPTDRNIVINFIDTRNELA